LSHSQGARQIAGDREAGVACPFCGDTVQRGEPISICQACGTVHHEPCWADRGCGSYACAPPRRDEGEYLLPTLTISGHDLESVNPLAATRSFPDHAVAAQTPNYARTNGLAIAALVCAIAGIPFFGLLTGLVAILLGSLAIGAIRSTGQRGNGLAVAGIVLGLGDVVGWLVFLTLVFSRAGPHLRLTDLHPDLTALENVDAKIKRAMRANVMIESRENGPFAGQSIGSGVVLRNSDGQALVLTNRHVVDPTFSAELPGQAQGAPGSSKLQVKMVDQSVQAGQVTWLAPGRIDLALVRIDLPSREARPAKWKMGRPRARVGDAVFAIGNPHGLGWTHTQGTISQFRLNKFDGRQVRIIQTQTVINAGNSGGGLYDHEGYLIGINTWSQDKRVSEGLNFAISLEVLASLSPPGVDLEAGADGPDEP
jgi:S1-C subfamily serine protease